MNARQAEGVGWSLRRWLFWILVMITGQVGLLFWLSEESGVRPSQSVAQNGVVLLWSEAGDVCARAPLEREDPTMFALVTTQGFSRSAWLGIPAREYQIPHREEPWKWLSAPAEALCDDFAEFVQTNLLSGDAVANWLPPSLARPMLAAPVVVAATSVRVEGALAQRSWLPNQPLPQQAEVLLTNTVVRVAVDEAGRTVSAAVLSNSGSAKADEDAVSFARAARFAPLAEPAPNSPGNPARLSFGTLIFQWSGIQWGPPLNTPVR